MGRKTMSLEAVNARLEGKGVRIRTKGDRLYLRARLVPPEGGPTKQYDLPMGYHNTEGLSKAEAQAMKLASDLLMERFRWEEWRKPKGTREKSPTVIEWVKEFRAYYQATHSLSERTWERHWQHVYKRLPQDQPLTEKAMLEVVLESDPNTRKRRQTCEKLQRLADFARVSIDLKPYKGNYSSNKSQPLEIPNDQVLLELRERIPSSPWRCVYDLMLYGGLRAHETMFSELIWNERNQIYVIYVKEGKTGPRVVYPLPPKGESCLLDSIELPKISGDYYEVFTDRIGKQFRRYGLPAETRIWRRAYRHRAELDYGFPASIVDDWMGHSSEVGQEIYMRDISAERYQDLYASRMK